METITKGKLTMGYNENWNEYVKTMKDHNVPDYQISIFEKVKYMFPKSHCANYAICSIWLNYYKIHFKDNYDSILEKYKI